MLMVKPLLTVGDFRVEAAQPSDEVADAGELLRNYEFNISQGIVQRVSRFFDALALMEEHGEVPPARGEGGEEADSARGGVMGFGRKRNVFNLEKKPAHWVAWEQQEKERIQKEAAKVAALETKVAEMQVLAAHAAALRPCAWPISNLRTFPHPLDPPTLCALRRRYAPPSPVAPPHRGKLRGGDSECS